MLPGDKLRSPFVKVAGNIESIPHPHKQPSHFDVNVGAVVLSVRRIVFFLHDGDLFIVKIASGPTHAQAVTDFIMQANDYAKEREDTFIFTSYINFQMPDSRRGTGFAPDFGIISEFPDQGGIALLRGVFIAEVEVFHRDASALIARMSKYATIPQNKYLCGIKIYKGQKDKVHRGAIGVVWKRLNRTRYVVDRIMNFGRQTAKPEEIDKWVEIESPTLGRLPPRTHSRRKPNRWGHESAVSEHRNTTNPNIIRTTTNTNVRLTITDADLVDGVVDEAGQPVVAILNFNFVIDFGRVLQASDKAVG